MEIASFEWKNPLEKSAELDKAEGQTIEQIRTMAQQKCQDPDQWLDRDLKHNVIVTSIDAVINLGRRYSVWPVNFGLACCAFEMIALAAPRFDISRFGMELFRSSPRQADLMIVAGTLTWKMAPQVKRIYEQMPEPKWVIAMGVCAISGGTFAESYSVVPGVNCIVPVDVYVPGCPPRADALLYGITRLHDKIKKDTFRPLK